MVTDRMSKHDIKMYIVLDRMIAETKTKHTGKKVHHGLTNEEVHHLRNAMRNLGRYTEEFGYKGWDFELVKAEYDDEVWKRFFPNEFFTKEEKREIEEDMWIHAKPSQYDCTGQRFTCFIDFYEVPNGTWIYHRIGYDY